MKAQNSIVAQNGVKKTFSQVISGEGAQKLIRSSLRDEASVKRFTGTLISVVNASEQLRQCDAGSIISAALRGEGAGLTYGHGYYVVPYGKNATYIMSYKGYIQLALATGMYADIDCVDVRDGERKGRDKRTGKPLVDLSVYETDEEREQHPIVGYKAYFELKDGYFREEYWTIDELLRHADRYSKAFSRELYLKWKRGERLTRDEQYTIENGSPWYTSTDRMMRKTVLRSLLNSGYAPLSNEVKSIFDHESESGEGDVSDIADVIPADFSVEEETGEIVEAEAPAAEERQETAEKPHRGRRKKEETEADQDAVANFFGDTE